MIKNYSALHESMQTRTLANGLRICYLQEGFLHLVRAGVIIMSHDNLIRP